MIVPCRKAHVLFMLVVFVCHSGVQHLFCCVLVFLRLVYPMLPVSLDCSLFTAPQVFSNVY